MGNIFRRRRQPVEELDEIVKRLRELETQLKEHIDSRADLLRTLIFAAVGLWGAGAAYGWLHFGSLVQRLGAVAVALVFAVLAFVGLRWLCMTSYDFVIERKRRRIAHLTERRVTIIEDVKENEKFKVAREIIEKYGDDADLSRLQQQAGSNAVDGTAATNLNISQLPHGQPQSQQPKRRGDDPQPPTADATVAPLATSAAGASMPRLHEMTLTRRFARTPVRPFIEPSGNPLDRLLDYVMGESINNRYALICASCRAHNGMALREEFEQVAYFCFKCGGYNPSRNEMRASGPAQQRRGGSPTAAGYSRPVFAGSTTDARTLFGSSGGGGPSIRSLSTITGRSDVELDDLDPNATASTTTTGQHQQDAKMTTTDETVPAEPSQPSTAVSCAD